MVESGLMTDHDPHSEGVAGESFSRQSPVGYTGIVPEMCADSRNFDGEHRFRTDISVCRDHKRKDGGNNMSLVPYVLESTSRGERSYDIYSRLLKDRIIFPSVRK